MFNHHQGAGGTRDARHESDWLPSCSAMGTRRMMTGELQRAATSARSRSVYRRALKGDRRSGARSGSDVHRHLLGANRCDFRNEWRPDCLVRRLVGRRSRGAPPGTPIAVSYDDLPPALDLVPFAVVDIPVDAELEVGTNVPQAAVLADGGVILVDEQQPTAHLVGRDGSVTVGRPRCRTEVHRRHPGPGRVRTGVHRRGAGLEFVAISLIGAERRAGRRPSTDRRSVALPRIARRDVRQHSRRRRRPRPPAGGGDDRPRRRLRRPGERGRRPAVADRRRQRRDRRFSAVAADDRAPPRLATAVRRRVAARPDLERCRRLLDLRRPADRG